MAETLINKNQAGEGIWTQDNLIAGTNISITEVPQPVIDANTVQLHHFNDSLKDEISGNDLNITSGTNTYNAGHFDKCIYPTTSGSSQFSLRFDKMNTFALASQSFTVDFWVNATDFVYGAGIGFKDASSGYIVVSASGGNYILNIANDLAGTTYNKNLTISNISGQWTHIAYVNDASAHKGYAFLNGHLLESWSQTNTVNSGFGFSGITRNCNIDELRVSNVARWTSDFTPYSAPYSSSASPTQYAINNTKADPDLSSYLQNTATGSNSLTIEGTAASQTYATNVGKLSVASYRDCTAVGYNAVANHYNGRGTAVGSTSSASGGYSTAIGAYSQASGANSVAVGGQDSGSNGTLASANYAVALGGAAQATQAQATALGFNAKATASNAIQIGNGTNSTANTAQIKGTQILNASGKIPKASIEEITILVEDYTE